VALLIRTTPKSHPTKVTEKDYCTCFLSIKQTTVQHSAVHTAEETYFYVLRAGVARRARLGLTSRRTLPRCKKGAAIRPNPLDQYAQRVHEYKRKASLAEVAAKMAPR